MADAKKGTLIVLEGLDGSGKATQAKLLAQHLKEAGKNVQEITFPDYASDSSALVKMYLAGQFGDKPDDVNAYAASSFYAVDRYASYKTSWGSFYEAGGVIIADRYTTSNAVHQCSKLPPEQWESFLQWLFDYEFRLLGLPAPDEVIYLQVDPAVSQKLMTQATRAKKTSTKKTWSTWPGAGTRRNSVRPIWAGRRSTAPRAMPCGASRTSRAKCGNWPSGLFENKGGILFMYRLMQPSDRAAVVALWQKERGDTAEFINTAMDRFAGEQNVYVAEENGQIEAAALAVPVTLQGRPGNYLFGLCGQGNLILAGLVDTLCAQQKLRGAGFTVAAPTSPERAALLQDKGFQKAFALRCLPREVERNLWSQAEFDSVTAKKLCELRERFWPDTVMLTPEKMAVVLGDLYSRGATIVSSEQGYGIYFRKEDTLYFVELMAEDDRSAEKLMEAAREKEVIVEKAVITVGAAQNLFLGEGTRQDYGMIRFEGEPFDVSESYMRLMLENG